MHRFYPFVFCLLAVLCFVTSGSIAQDDHVRATLISTSSAHQEKISETVGYYRLGAGDRLEIVVFGEEDLSGKYKIDGQGYISLPLIGSVKVGGLDSRSAEDLIAKRLSDGYIRNPSVSIQVFELRPFYILGEVKTPGSYQYVSNMSILNAVALAGGFTYRANKDEVEVIRGAQKPGASAQDVDIEENVMPGDIILVKERFF